MTPHLIPAQNPGALTGRGNNTYLIGTTLIDAGVGAPGHLDAMAAVLGDRALSHVIVTHGHSDHISGVPEIRQQWNSVRVSKYFPDQAVPDDWSALSEGDRVEVDGGTLRVLITPGHAADHLCLFDEVSGDLFAGDMVVAGTTVLVPPRSKGGNMREYLQSLARLRDLDAGRILPGHGPVIDRPRDRINAMIEHRLVREAQVLACLKAGFADPAVIVAKIYEGLPPTLMPFAEQTVIAHLEKIDDERQAG